MDEFEAAVDRLRTLAAQERQAAEREEAKLGELNDMLRKLCTARAAGAEEVLLLGDVVQEQPYAPGGGHAGSALLAIAALEIPGGLGVVLMDRTEYRQAVRGEAQAGKPFAVFVPLADCPLELKGRLVPEARSLVARLFQRLH